MRMSMLMVGSPKGDHVTRLGVLSVHRVLYPLRRLQAAAQLSPYWLSVQQDAVTFPRY